MHRVLEILDQLRCTIAIDGGTEYVVIGSHQRGMHTVLRQATGLPVSVAEDPLLCVALGTGHAVENIGRLRGVLSSMY
jgi:rod shape-determining protein MreB